ncbi:MAG: ATP-binding protein [Weeksellaceae bacterium]
MEIIDNQKILETIGIIYEKAKNCKFKSSFLESLDGELEFLSQYFKTTKNQSFFISIVFAHNYKGTTVDIGDISEYLSCNPMRLLKFNSDFDFLHSKGILKREKIRSYMKLTRSNDQFTINERVTEAIFQNLPMPEIIENKIEDIIGLLENLNSLAIKRDTERITSHELFVDAKKLIVSNAHFPLIEKVHQFHLGVEDAYLFLYLVWKTVAGNEYVSLNSTLEDIYDHSSKRVKCIQDILNGNHILVKNNLVETVEAVFFSDTEIKLTDTAHEMLNECEIKLFLTKKKKGNILTPSEIPIRELIFDPVEMQQLDLIENLLEEKAFKETQERLTKKALPKGVTILLHGAPGTGKTELAKQLARRTEREIMKVDISESKSMWFGESEKLIKRIFTDYTSYSKKCKRTPILLFNEADALISTRQGLDHSNSQQTQNAIQNIILEELENFEGILMATTNLASNLDSAFERRFLFKVEFKKPSVSIRAKIWKLKLPLLKKKECELLAEEFNFSGGEIDNIVRKNEIQEIVNGTLTNFASIESFCREELISTKTNSIGFSHVPN